jgi:GNAT superfamily N-acetyltransferase
VLLRRGRDSDADGFIALIGRCWADYPGCVLELEHEERELFALESYCAGRGGALWTAEDAGAVVGMAAIFPTDSGVWELKKLYVHPDRHGSGLAHRLLDAAEAHAMAAGATRLVLWSDTRFKRAHRFYEKRSWVRDGPIRALDDLSNTLEFGYAKPVDGIAILGASAAASAERRLADILVACVDGGASVSFLAPLAPAQARAFMREAARQVAAGQCILLAAWSRGILAGTVQVQLGTPQNQPHRAEICKMLVHPDARRQGLAERLMLSAETAAAAAARTLLTLDTLTGAAGERLYRRLGWIEVGVVPGYSVNAAGWLESTTLFYKQLGN